MLNLESSILSRKFKLFLWLLMSFQAGYINTGGFLVFGNFVSHVTGTSSLIGMGFAGFDWFNFMTFLTMLVAFISGAALPGHFIGRRLLDKRKPEYILITGKKVCLFALILVVSEYYFTYDIFSIKLLLVFLLSLACGIQNATCALATGGFLKPTHMTGLSTDIGINLFRFRGLDKTSQKYKTELQKNQTRILILLSFIIGSSSAFAVFTKHDHYGFVFPFLSSVCMFATTIYMEKASSLNRSNAVWLQVSVVSVFFITFLCGFILTATKF